jgi:hypothetical protein
VRRPFYDWGVDRTDPECRLMLDVCGFTFDSARDVFYGTDGRVVSVDTILAHTRLWLALWITRTLSPGDDSIEDAR